MTYFLDFRTRDVGGAVAGPFLYSGDGVAPNQDWSVISTAATQAIVAGRDILFATHGFNVSRPRGAYSLGLLDEYLQLAAPGLYIAMLWPGDCWLPVVDYPFEGDVSMDCGGRLAGFILQCCAGARSLSFASHSLGARLVLEAVSHLATAGRPAQSVCLTAGAINRDCLLAQYAAAADATRVSVLASHSDDVLKLAYTIGDPIADLLHDDHTPFQAALGYDGPPSSRPQPVARPWQIQDCAGYGHGNYLPPGSPTEPPDPRWQRVADFMKRAFLGQPQSWPPG